MTICQFVSGDGEGCLDPAEWVMRLDTVDAPRMGRKAVCQEHRLYLQGSDVSLKWSTLGRVEEVSL